MTQRDDPKDRTPPAAKEGGVKTGREHEKKSFTDSAAAPPEPVHEGGVTEEAAPTGPGREGGMVDDAKSGPDSGPARQGGMIGEG